MSTEKTYTIHPESCRRYGLTRNTSGTLNDCLSTLVVRGLDVGPVIESCDGGTLYVYASQDDADADETGADAVAAIEVQS